MTWLNRKWISHHGAGISITMGSRMPQLCFITTALFLLVEAKLFATIATTEELVRNVALKKPMC